MALEDVKENLSEQFKQIWGRVRESDAYLQASEKYQSLSPAGQTGVLIGAVLVGFLIVMAVPASFYFSSSSEIGDYESKRDTIRELFKVSREAAAIPRPPPPVTASDLTNMARTVASTARLQPEQITSVNETPANVAGISKAIDQAGIQVALAKVNLKQIVDIGAQLQNMQGTARMMGLEVKANLQDPKYYDVVYKIVAFSAKPAPVAGAGGSKKGKKK